MANNAPPVWRTYDDIPRCYRSKLDNIIKLLADANKSGEYVDNANVRKAFINNHVFDH